MVARVTSEEAAGRLGRLPQTAAEAGGSALAGELSPGSAAGQQDTLSDGAATGPAASVGRNVSFLAAGQLATWTMTAIWTLVVPRTLGALNMGLLVTAWSAASIFGVLLGLGARSYIVKEVVASPGRSETFMNAGVVLRLGLLPLFLVAVVAYGHIVHFRGSEIELLYLAAAATGLTLLAEPIQAIFQAKEHMQYLAYGDLVGKTAQSGAGILVALVGLGTLGVTSVWLVAAGLVISLSAWWARPYARLTLSVDFATVRTVARRSLVFYVTDVFFMIYLWIDTVMLGVLVRPEVVGWYGVATRLYQTLMFIPTIMATAWLPRLVAAHREGLDRFRHTSRAPLEWVVFLSIPVGVATATLAGPAIHLLYGAGYAGAVPVLVILAVTAVPTYVNIMLCQLLIAQDRLSRWTWFMAGAAVVNPVLNFFLIRAFEHGHGNGAIGASLSLLITELAMMLGGLVLLGRQLEAPHWVSRLLRAVLVGGVMWAVIELGRPLGLFASGALGLLSFLLSSWLLGLPSREGRLATVAAARRRLARLRAAWPRRPSVELPPAPRTKRGSS